MVFLISRTLGILHYHLVTNFARSFPQEESISFETWLRERDRIDAERRKRLLELYALCYAEHREEQRAKAEKEDREDREKRLQIVHALMERFAAAMNSPELLSLSQVNFVIESISSERLMEIVCDLRRELEARKLRENAA